MRALPPSWPATGAPSPAGARRPAKRLGRRLLLHTVSLLIAIACFAAYAHFKLDGRATASMVCLVLAAVFGFAPLRDVLRLGLQLEGKALHVAHGLGSLALVGLPLSGAVPGTSMLTHTLTAPLSIMGAAQALMHSNQPRNAKQAAALQRFVESIPQVAQFTSAKDLTSPQNALRAATVLSDIIGKAQALGQTELDADPNFQSAVQQVFTRFASNLGLDAVDLAVRNVAANPTTASAAPGLRAQLARARATIARTR